MRRSTPGLLLLVPALLAAGCARKTPAPSADAATVTAPTTAPTASASAAPSASSRAETRPVPEWTTFTGKVAGDATTLVVERSGANLRVAYMQGSGLAVLLSGKATDSGSLEASASGGKAGSDVKLRATIDASGHLVGTLTDAKVKTPTKLALVEGAPAALDAGRDASFAGTLGKSSRIRAKLKRDKHLLAGVYRYKRSKEDLALSGTLSDATGAFDLVEKNGKGQTTGHWRGIAVGSELLFGTWSSADETKTLPLTLEASTRYPEIETVAGGVKVIPVEEHTERGEKCAREVIHPTFAGTPVATALDAALAKEMDATSGLSASDCEGADEYGPYSFESAYEVWAGRPDFVALSIMSSSFTGGAHPNYAVRCVVADTRHGKLVHLSKELSPDARAKLSTLASEALRKENSVDDLTSAGFFSESVSVDENTELCVADDKGALSLVVQYSPYEVAPYALGPVSASIPAAQARALFPAGSFGAAILR